MQRHTEFGAVAIANIHEHWDSFSYLQHLAG